MATLKIDDASMLKKIQEELGYTSTRAKDLLDDLKSVQPNLFPLIESWYAGECVGYEFHGVSIEFIMEKQYCDYLGAITWLNFLIKNPDMVETFKSMEFRQR